MKLFAHHLFCGHNPDGSGISHLVTFTLTTPEFLSGTKGSAQISISNHKITEIRSIGVFRRVYEHGCDVLDTRVFLRNIVQKQYSTFFCVHLNTRDFGRILEFSANPRVRLAFE